MDEWMNGLVWDQCDIIAFIVLSIYASKNRGKKGGFLAVEEADGK